MFSETMGGNKKKYEKRSAYVLALIRCWLQYNLLYLVNLCLTFEQFWLQYNSPLFLISHK